MQSNESKLESIGARIAQIRGNTSRDAFAPVVGISKSTLQRYEAGEGAPDANFLLALHQHYGIDPLWLLTGEGPMKISEPGETEEKRGRVSPSGIAIIAREVAKSFKSSGITPERYEDPLVYFARIGFFSAEIYNGLLSIDSGREEARRNMAFGAALAERLRLEELESQKQLTMFEGDR
jgi:transcriptional regulator with XRE-family HTH domain